MAETQTTHEGVSKRWTSRLVNDGWTPVVNIFLENLTELQPHPNAKGLSASEALLIIQLISFKWDERDPHPTVGTLAARMGCTARHVRQQLKTLEELGLIERKLTKYGPTHYGLDGLFERLEAIQEQQKTAEESCDEEEE